MNLTKKLRLQMLLQNSAFAILLMAIAVLILFLTRDLKPQWDATHNQRHTLGDASAGVLKQLQGPVTITAYATKEDPVMGDVRQQISEFVAPYRLAKPDLVLKFVDPREQPKQTTAAGIRSNGEMLVEFGGRSEHLSQASEQALTNLLMRLLRGKERTVAVMDGHGERKIDGNANHDLGEFGRQLGQKGFRTQSLSLLQAPEVPDNVALLIIASPRADVLPGEVGKIKRYLDKGGNLLWLIDQEPLRGLQPVADLLGLTLTAGTVIDPDAGRLQAPATLALSSNYGHHAITDGNTLASVFPFARKIAFSESAKDWQRATLVEVAQNGWLELGSIEGKVRFDKDQDVKGPIVVASALERKVENKQQRVVVVGSGHFLANQFVTLLGNIDVGVNMVNWLSGDDNLINVQPRANPDSNYSVSSPAAYYAMALFFLIALPLTFLGTGVAIWWRRRKA